MADSVGQIGERSLIAMLSERMSGNADIVVGVGDDAAVIRIDSAEVVLCTDAMVENVHFRREWSTAQQIGAKIVARNFADVAAMGAVPVGFTLSLTLPSDTDSQWALDLVEGVNLECSRVGAAFLGGDTSAGDAVVIVGSAIGDMRGLAPVRRSGARPGDVLTVHGHLGCAAAGLALLAQGQDIADALESGSATCISAQLAPQPDYAAARLAAAQATAMIDTSDGLLIDAQHLALSSSVDINIHRRDVPVLGCVRDAASACGADMWRWVLCGGEDHAFLATFASADDVPAGYVVIGAVTPGSGVVTVDGQPWAQPMGFEHFTSTALRGMNGARTSGNSLHPDV